LNTHVVPVKSDNKALFPKSDALLQHFADNFTCRNFIFAISHSDYRTVLGGTEKVIRAEKALFEKMNISYLHVFPTFIPFIPPDDNHMVGVSIDGNLIGTYTLSELGLVFDLLVRDDYFRPVACHLHHLKGISLNEVNHLIRILNPPKIRFFIHDYYAICPQFNLLRDGGVFCGGPPVESDICAACSWGRGRSSHTKSFGDLFRSHDMEFIAPSRMAADIWNATALYEGTTVRVVPHFRLSEVRSVPVKTTGNPKRLRIAYVGYQADIKGWQTWSRITQEVNSDFYEFYHIGAAEDQLPGVLHLPLPLENGEENPVADLMKKLDIDIALLWSIWPETYSFTLFESLAGRCFIITNPQSGNIASVVRDRSAGAVFAAETEVLDFLKDSSRVHGILTEYKTRCPDIELSWNPSIPEETVRMINDPVQPERSDPPGMLHNTGRSDVLLHLESELQLGQLVFDLGNRVTEQDAQLLQRETELHNLYAERESSIVWRLITIFHSVFIDRGLPLGTQRRRLYDRSLVWGRNLIVKRGEEEKIE
jgi:hypothetical protein